MTDISISIKVGSSAEGISLENLLTDSNGTILLDYKGNLGLQYNPNAIAQMALGYYDFYIDSVNLNNYDLQNTYTNLFLRQAEWFVKHGRMKKLKAKSNHSAPPIIRSDMGS